MYSMYQQHKKLRIFIILNFLCVVYVVSFCMSYVKAGLPLIGLILLEWNRYTDHHCKRIGHYAISMSNDAFSLMVSMYIYRAPITLENNWPNGPARMKLCLIKRL